MRSACTASLFSQEHVCVVACHPCTCVCLRVCFCVCVCASTVALNGFLNITSNDFCSERVSRSAFGGLARSRHRAESAHRHPILTCVCVCVCVFVYSFALEEKSWRHKHGSASPEKVALTSFSCFLLGCPKHTHTHADYASFPQRHLAACPRMTQHPSGFFFLHTLLLMFQTMTRQGGFWHV